MIQYIIFGSSCFAIYWIFWTLFLDKSSLKIFKLQMKVFKLENSLEDAEDYIELLETEYLHLKARQISEDHIDEDEQLLEDIENGLFEF